MAKKKSDSISRLGGAESVTRRSQRMRAEHAASLDEAYLEAMGDAAAPEDQELHDSASQLRSSGLHGVTEGEARKTFGPTGTAWIEIEVASDGMEAVVHGFGLGEEESLTVKDLATALEDLYRIRSGVSEGALKRLIASAAEGDVTGDFIVASGVPPEPGEDGRVVYLFMGREDERVPLPFTELKSAFDQPDIDQVLGRNLKARMVTPGEYLASRVPPTEAKIVPPGDELARREPPTDGNPGTDVFGGTRTLPGKDVRLHVGANVEESDNTYTSSIYGYVCVIGQEISVLPPIWVSADKMEAHFIHFPQVRPEEVPTSEWLLKCLELVGVRHGILETMIEKLCQHSIPPREKTHFLVAQGMPEVPGVDSRISFTFDYEKKAGTMRPDGSLDLRERNAAIGVSEGQHLGDEVPATKGHVGMNVLGEEIPTTDGVEREFTAGENVRTDTEDGTVKFYSEIDGAVFVQADTVEVHEVFRIDGDIDYDTGNVEVPKDLEIIGDVKSGFSVKAGGSVTITGVVENGVSIHAGGDVAVGNGIVGESTKVVAFGDVQTKFIQNSHVLARGNVVVGSYIINGMVRSGGEVTVLAGTGARSGSIIGGEVIATTGIEAKRIGSPDTDRTVVGIGPNPELTARLSKLSETVDACDKHIQRAMLMLGLDEKELEDIDGLLERIPAAGRERARRVVEEMRTATATRAKAMKKRRQLEDEVAHSISRATIKATEKAYADVRIKIGSDMSAVPEDAVRPVFYRTANGIRWRPLDHGG